MIIFGTSQNTYAHHNISKQTDISVKNSYVAPPKKVKYYTSLRIILTI